MTLFISRVVFKPLLKALHSPFSITALLINCRLAQPKFGCDIGITPAFLKYLIYPLLS